MKSLILEAAVLMVVAPAMAQSPSDLDRFVGYYQLKPDILVHFTRNGDHLVVEGSGQPAIPLSPSGSEKFTAPQGEWHFEKDATGSITNVILTQHGDEIRAPRIGAAQAQAISAAQEARIKANIPSPGTEGALRRQIEAFAKGQPDYGALAPSLASVIRKNAQMAVELVQKHGALKSLEFRKILPGGANVYDAKFEHGDMEWVIAPLTSDGKINHLAFKES